MKKLKAMVAFVLVLLFVFISGMSVCAITIIDVKHDNTKEEIVEIVKKYPHSGFDGTTTRYLVPPSTTAPYAAGSLNQEDLDDALNAVKVVRYLAGVPYEHIQFTEELNSIAQHGAVLLAASDQFSHTPKKPADMDDEFFELAYRGCNESNIYAGKDSISEAVLGFIFDSGQSNISRAGHRRWILKPGAEKFGIGYARESESSYSGNRINMYVFDGLSAWRCESDSYIAWPPSGSFPIQYFAASKSISQPILSPWSINLGEPYEEPEKDDVVLKLTRKRDNKVWVFDEDTPDLGDEGLSNDELHFAVDNGGYGISKAIVFRPDINSLGTIKDGDVFTVEISGIKYTNGKAAKLSYDINFFDLAKALDGRIILTINQRDAIVFGETKRSDVAPVMRNYRTMLPARFVAENLGAEVAWDEKEQKVTITHGEKIIELFIGSDVAFVNGEKVIIDAPAFMENNRTYTPVRFIAETLGAEVEWKEETQEVIITAK